MSNRVNSQRQSTSFNEKMECSFLELIRISVVWPPSWVRYAYTVKLCSQGVTYGFRQAKESSLSKSLKVANFS